MLSNHLLKSQKVRKSQLFMRELQHVFAQSSKPMLHYITPSHGWADEWVGYYVTRWVNKLGMPSHISDKPARVKGDILHYGDIRSLMKYLYTPSNELNWLVASVFYGDRERGDLTQELENVIEFSIHLNRLVVSSELMQQKFLDWGVREDKLICIPLGVDLNTFFPSAVEEREQLREKFQIPKDAFCIGSFQKDGLGWEEGDEPRLSKGPDVLLETLSQLKSKIPSLFVFLTGPSRGYVKNGLDKLDIPYRHVLMEDYYEIRDCYGCLDAYLITSREDGGPNALLEALACDVPVVSTQVGMAQDVIVHEENGLLCDVEDVDALSQACLHLFEDRDFSRSLVIEGHEVVRQYDWSEVAALYFEHVYAPLMVQRYS